MEDVVAQLREALGEAVCVEPDVLAVARADASGHVSASAPLAVITARSIDEVQLTLRIATASHTPVVIRGAGTGLAGGAVAGAGEIVLSTVAMNRVLEVSPANGYAVVEPGILNAELNSQLAVHGMWFAPDPASRAISTVGGNIATNAGGLLCAKYGVTREAVLGLKVVLADGRLMELGHRTVKGVTGLDFTALMIGSEGTLAVIVEATVKILPLVPGAVTTISSRFESEEDAARTAALITSSGMQPAIMELIGSSAMAAISTHLGVDQVRGSQLLIQFDGPRAQSDGQAALAIVRSVNAVAELTDDASEGERLFAFRRAFHPAMLDLGTVLIEDVCVPRTELSAMFAAIGEIEHRYNISIPTVAHAGDGNLHPNFICDGPEVPDAIWAAADELFLSALRLGGTLTGEHGIGILKRRWLRDELGVEQVALQKQVKAVFDPLGILNPGKVF